MNREGFESQICFLLILVTNTSQKRQEMSPFSLDLYTGEYNSDRFCSLGMKEDQSNKGIGGGTPLTSSLVE